MSAESLTALIVAVTSLVVSILGALSKAITSAYTSKKEQENKAQHQVFEQQTEIIARLQERIDALEHNIVATEIKHDKELNILHKEHRGCMDENRKMIIRITQLETEITVLKNYYSATTPKGGSV